MRPALTALVALPLAGLFLACDPPETPKIDPADCEKLAVRMGKLTAAEQARNAQQELDIKKELTAKYLESCKAELPTTTAFECAMKAPSTGVMQQCR